MDLHQLRSETSFRIHHALKVAGLVAGEHHKGSGWSDEGCLCYEPPKQGYVVRSDRWYAANTERFYVDHAGKGRKEALPRYLAALQAAGITAHIDTLTRYASLRKPNSKQVVWVEIDIDRTPHWMK